MTDMDYSDILDIKNKYDEDKRALSLFWIIQCLKMTNAVRIDSVNSLLSFLLFFLIKKN